MLLRFATGAALAGVYPSGLKVMSGWYRAGRGMALGVLVAVPAGLALERRRRLAEPLIRLLGTSQTIPSIALLAFMIPLLGVGALPAIVALWIYSLYPILRNTFSGVRDADAEAVAAASALGMTEGQILRSIRLPLAAPTIMAGVRTAGILTVGTATLAAFIGAEDDERIDYQGFAVELAGPVAGDVVVPAHVAGASGRPARSPREPSLLAWCLGPRKTDGSRDSKNLRSVKQKGGTTNEKGGTTNAQSSDPNFWFYEADVALFSDFDNDGYYFGIDLMFDADTTWAAADVYAVVYLSYEYGPWNEYAETEDFTIYGTSGGDNYIIETELVAGYPTGSYDMLIELFDAYDGSFLASIGPDDTSELALLPLEDSVRDTPAGTTTQVVVNRGGGGAVGFFLLFALLAVRMTRRPQAASVSK